MTGIKVKRIKIFNFVLVGTLAAFAGVITAARLASASVNIGQGLEMQVITACVIGGASLNGGEGTVFGAFLGTLLMAALINALNLIGVDVYWQNVLNGVILIGAVVLDTVLKKKREESM
jgi:ribose transport system permease protein